MRQPEEVATHIPSPLYYFAPISVRGQRVDLNASCWWEQSLTWWEQSLTVLINRHWWTFSGLIPMPWESCRIGS